jgi:PAS domain S-box-containing protein
MLQDMINRASYMAHGYCLLWKPWLVAIHASSDILIFGSYFAIPVAIWIFLSQRKDLTLKPLAVLFAAFIFLCGLTHAIQAVTLWWPVYEVQGYVKAITAIVSVTTAIAIFPLIPKAVAIPSPRQLQIVNEGLALEIAAHRDTLAALERAKDELELRVAERTKELEHSKARFEALVKASAQVVWTCNAKGEVSEDSSSWRSFTGQTREELLGNHWLDAIHPEDRSRTLAAWEEAVRTNQIYSVEYRLCHSEEGWRWMAAKAVPLMSASGEVREWVGMNIDIDARKRSEQHAQFIMRELSHRTKNLLAVVYSMARQAAKYSRVSDFVSDFGARLQGLSRSHDLLVTSNWMGVPLHEHVRSQLQPFAPSDKHRIRFTGPHVMLRPEATQALGLAFHELATNATKHGALALPDGQIDITWAIETEGTNDIFKLAWRERSQRLDPPRLTRQGFGSTVLTRVVPETLSGEAQYGVGIEGISWEIEAPLREVASLSSGCPSRDAFAAARAS